MRRINLGLRGYCFKDYDSKPLIDKEPLEAVCVFDAVKSNEMKDRFNELNEKALKLMQEQRDFAKEAIKPGKTALPWEVWVNVMSEETGYEPKRVGIVSVEKVEPYEYPYFLYMDTNGYEYKSEDLSPAAQWEVVNAYMSSL